MGNAESASIPNERRQPIQRNGQPIQRNGQPIQRNVQNQNRQPIQRNVQNQNRQPVQRIVQNQNRQPVQRNINNNQIQEQLYRQQQQIEAQRRHQKLLEDKLKLQEENNRMFQSYIEQQVNKDIEKKVTIEDNSRNYEVKNNYQNEEQYEEQPDDNSYQEEDLRKYDPYEILGIEKNADINRIRKAFKKRALQYHPDRGGNPKIFKIIEESYQQLLDKYENEHKYDRKVNQEVRNVEYTNDLNRGMQNRHVDKDNFNLNKFNKIFTENKMEDVNDDGYGNIMNKTNVNVELDKTIKRDNFNINNFNNNFNNIKKNKPSDQIIEYKEPVALISGDSLSFSELGQGKIDDFSSSQNNLQFTDYKRAHLTETTLIDPNKVKYKQYNSLNEFQRDRSNISYTMSNKDREYYDNKKRQEDLQEKRRQSRVAASDMNVESLYNKINTNMIKH